MKILLVQNMLYLPTLGGANKITKFFMEELVRRGHTCKAIVPAKGAYKLRTKRDLLEELTNREIAFKETRDVVVFVVQDVEVHAVNNLAQLHLYAAEKQREFAPEVTLAASQDPGFIILRSLINQPNARVILVVQSPWDLPFGLGHVSGNKAEIELIQQTTGIITVSKDLQQRIVSGCGCHAEVISFPVYGTHPFPDYGCFEKGFTTLINPCAYKGISIFTELAKRFPEVHFATVPTWGTTEADLAKLSALQNIRILDPTDNIDQFLSKTRILLVPSLWPEGYPLVVTEAMLRGIPVVASNSGGLPESKLGVDYVLPVNPIKCYEGQCDDKKLPIPIVPKQDITPWVDALVSLNSNRDLYQRISSESKQAADVFISGLTMDPFEQYLKTTAQQNYSMFAVDNHRKPVSVSHIRNSRIKALSAEKRALLLHKLRRGQIKTKVRHHIQRVDRKCNSEGFPISFAQQRFWLLHQLNPNSRGCNSFETFLIKGDLNVEALQQSLGFMIQRHEVMRTSFNNIDGAPRQFISTSATIELPVSDLSILPAKNRISRVKKSIAKFVRQPFDLSTPPLIRTSLYRLNDQQHILVFVFHCIVFDARSIELFMQDLSSNYNSIQALEKDKIEEPIIHCLDFAIWQRKTLTNERLKILLAYWKEQLSQISYVEIPTDHPRPHLQTYQGARSSFCLSQSLIKKLKKLEKYASITSFMTILAALACLIHRYTGSDNVIIGSPVDSRNQKETESLIGCFTNILALCIDISGNPTFRQLLDRVRGMVLNAHAHMDLPFERLIDELQPNRSLSHSPLFQVMFNMLEFKFDELRLDGLEATPLQCVNPAALFDLTFSARERDEGVQISLVYNTDLFDRTTIGRMMGHLQTLLSAAVEDPDNPVSDIPMLTTAERNQLLVDWNKTAKPFQHDKCIHQLFEEQVVRTPQAIAAVCGNKHITYEQLNRLANQLAHYLQKKGIGPDIFVGICLHRSLDMLVGLLGILKAGGAYIPLDPVFPKKRLITMLTDAHANVVVTEQAFLDSFANESLDMICLDRDRNSIDQEKDANPAGNVMSNNSAYLIYTSGSTGKPKGIMVRHRSVINLIEWVNREFEINSNDRLLFITSICFDLSVYDIFGILAAGASIHIASEVGCKDPERLLHILCTDHITFWNSAPAAFQQLIPLLQEKKVYIQDSYLRLVFLSGDWIPVSLPDSIRNYFPNCRLISLGGATEATVWSNYYIIGDVNPDWASIPYGKPIQNSQYYILDDFLNPCPIGVPGKLYISGECLCAGYVDPEQTKERFIANPFNADSGALIYDTGDMARFHADGNIEFLGRIDHQVKINGYRIELGEIEMTLAGHPEIREAVALVQEDCSNKKYIVAYIIPLFACSVNTVQLRDFLKTKLPDYMLPSAFLILEKMPLTPNGKIDRKALPVATSDHFAAKSSYIAPRNQLEEILKNIWVDILDMTKISVNDNFFELGGHSLLAVKTVVRIRETLNSDLPFQALFEFPTIAELAELLGDTTMKTPIHLQDSIVSVDRDLYSQEM